MRTINATFEDSDFRKLERAKNKSGKKNWPEFLLWLQGLIEENDQLQKKLAECEKKAKED